MAARDRNTLDLTHQKLRIAPDVMIWPQRERGDTVYRIEIPQLHQFFSVGYEEYVFISLLNGQTTIPQACGLAASRLGSRAPSAQQAKAIARWLLSNGLAHLAADPPPVRHRAIQATDAQSVPVPKLLGKLNPFWLKVPVPTGDRWINSWAHACQFLFSPRAVVAGVLLIGMATIMLATNWKGFVAAAPVLFHPTNWIWLLVTWVFLKVIHELAHAIVCNQQGGSVRETGFVFILFAPLAYVDVSSCWRMESRWSRIAVSSAGMYIELVVAALAVFGWSYVETPQLRFLLHNLVVVAGVSTILFNANVLMRFDGYFILADLMEIPNLYSEGSTAVRGIARHWITGQPPSPGRFDRWRGRFVTVYGCLALAWRVTICVSLAIAASTMFAGAGILLALMGGLVWVGRPAARLFAAAKELKVRSPLRFWRGVGLGGASVSAVVWAVAWCPLPTSILAPAVVRYSPDTMVRAPADGFVVVLHVDDGAAVGQGDRLLQLENRELTFDLRQLEIEYAQNEIRLRQATGQHDAGRTQILRENQLAVQQRIDQLRGQVAALQVRAPTGGTVVARQLTSQLGTYVREGDPLLVVADGSAKELVAMIRHSEIQDVRRLVGSEVKLRSSGFVTGVGHLDQIEPRASDELPAIALAATAGGTMAVQSSQNSDDASQLKLVYPHFRGRIALPAATAAVMPAGARTEVWLGYRSATIYQRLSQRFHQLWRSASQQ